MKKLIAALVVGVFSALSVFAQTKKPPRVMEDMIQEMESQLSSALQKGDAATVDRIVADEHVEVTPQGALRHKDYVMTLARARAAAPHALPSGRKSRSNRRNSQSMAKLQFSSESRRRSINICSTRLVPYLINYLRQTTYSKSAL